MSEKKATPAMQQYWETKEKYSDGFLFFQMGDFFEMFGDDAKEVGKLLDLTVTTRDRNSENPLPMAGVPLRAKDKYIKKLLELGYKVIVCEQTTVPSPGKLVEREVTQVLSPGMAVEEAFLDERKEDIVISLTYMHETWYGAGIDVSIGKIQIFEAQTLEILKRYISAIEPRVILVTKNLFVPDFLQAEKFIIEKKDGIQETKGILDKGHPLWDRLKKLNTPQLESIALLLGHVLECHFEIPRNIQDIQKFKIQDFNMSDKTFEHLEIFQNSKDRTENKSLFKYLNKTETTQGTRYLRKIMKNPLSDKIQIEDRQNQVEELAINSKQRQNLQEELSHCRDLERISSRVVKRKCRPQDLLALKQTLESWEEIKSINK